ncbi:MAG: hypothetical protein M3Y90_18430 [Actinomycetota bacterium]|nr:hypothetical protein [Actinomycetota bacterium]
MVETATSSVRMLSGAAATAVLLAAGLVATPEISTHALDRVSAEVALTADTIFDGLTFDAPAVAFDAPGLAEAVAFDTSGVAEAFDIAGLINAEFAAAQGFFNSLFSLPGTLFNDVEGVITSLINLDFGMAFSELFSIPQDIVNYVLGLPGLVVNTLYEMAVVIPGEYLFNFG